MNRESVVLNENDDDENLWSNEYFQKELRIWKSFMLDAQSMILFLCIFIIIEICNSIEISSWKCMNAVLVSRKKECFHWNYYQQFL